MKVIEIINILKREYSDGFSGYIGFRKPTDDESYNIGDQCRNSYDWDYEYDLSSYNTENPIELDGTCATGTYIEDDEDAEMNKLLYSVNPLNTVPMKTKSLLKMQPSLLLSNRATP